MRKQKEEAISPVVGVMLMLVVTIIIAAVVSGFSGGLIGGNAKKTPSLAMDVKITNSGFWNSSGFSATVTSVSDPIPTKDLKLVTSWTTTNRTTGERIISGNESMGGVQNVNVIEPPGTQVYQSAAPYGFGMPFAAGQNAYSGRSNMSAETPYSNPDQQFGSYSLTSGVSLGAKPYGSMQDGSGKAYDHGYGMTTQFQYSSGGSGYIDPMQAVLGTDWPNLHMGDTVTVKVIYVPSGRTIFTKDVTITEG